MAEDEAADIKVRRYDFYPTDWLEGTISLTHLERSVYITICAAIYAQGGPVEALHVRKLCTGRGFERAVAGLVAKGKVIRNGAELVQERCIKEVGKAQERVYHARANGATGGRPIKGLAKPNGSFLANPAEKLTTKYHKNKKTSSSDREVSARASRPNGGAEPARNDDAWRGVGDLLGTPPLPDNAHDRRVCEHLEFLRFHGGPQDTDLYLAAQNSGDPDAARRMFDLTEEWMTEEGWDDNAGSN